VEAPGFLDACKINVFLTVEAPGFSPAKSGANKSGFSRGEPELNEAPFHCRSRHG
jgi:hypothetical protein